MKKIASLVPSASGNERNQANGYDSYDGNSWLKLRRTSKLPWIELMEPSKTLHVRFDDRWFTVEYPDSSPSIREVLEAVLKGREYPPCLPRYLRPRVIVDIGGNVGAAAIWFHVRYPDAKVISFEPSPQAFAFLQRNTSTLPNVEIRNYGLLDRDVETVLHSGQNLAQSSTVPHQETTPQTETVMLRRASSELDSLGIDRVSILKLDTEGCEVAILRDLHADWLHRVDSIYVEYHSEADRREIDQLLSQHFYLINAVVSRGNRGTFVYLSREPTHQSQRFIEPAIELDQP